MLQNLLQRIFVVEKLREVQVVSDEKDKLKTVANRAALVGALLKKGDISFALNDPELIKWALEFGLGALIYFHYHDQLSGEELDLCRNQYRFGAMQDLKFAAAYSDMQKIFEAEAVDFIPVKGMALIRQKVYPDGALRLHCDMDILLRSEKECRRAFDILKQHGWRYSGQQEFYQHIPALYKKGLSIELHHHLPSVDDENKIAGFWSDIAVPVSGREYSFPKEFHFAVAMAHCCNHHDWEYGARFLLDAGVLSADEKFDWEKCFGFCHEFGIGKPELLVSAFPEVFDVDKRVDDRLNILRGRMLGDFIPFVALEVNAKDRFSWEWIRRHAESMSFSRLRGRYNAEKAPWYKMMQIVLLDFLHKFRTFCRYFFSSSLAKERKSASDECRELLELTVNPNKL